MRLREGSHVCDQDYLGPNLLFERQFERIFRVTRSIFERVWQVAANTDTFFLSSVVVAVPMVE